MVKDITKSNIANRIISVALSLTMLFSFLAVISGGTTAEAAQDYGLASNIQDGVILHCFDWTYNDIRSELPNIAAAGFTTVQTSPAQPALSSGAWYWMYQPLGFYIGANPLGNKDELAALCREADNYGIKIIVDVVANHLAGDHSNIQGDLKDAQYWHNQGAVGSYYDRYQITHGDIGMADINSENSYVQSLVSNYINELKGIGVDGIRWDAAKHIGLPSEGCGFWPAVTNSGLYNYGEILVGPDDRSSGNEDLMREYTNYMSVTDSAYGRTLRDSFASNSAPSSSGNWSNRGISGSKLVYWGESHDTYSNNGEYGEASQTVSQNVVDRAYAVAASQNSITALYFSRPYSTVKDSILSGQKGSTHFTSPEVAAVNHFHNAMIGQASYYTTGSNCSVICRTGGAVIVAGSGGNFNVTVPNGGGTTKPGTYKDEITGETWTVTADSISGKIGSSGIAVIYGDGSSSGGGSTDPSGGGSSGGQDVNPSDYNIYYRNTKNWSEVYAYFWSDNNVNMTVWPGVKMTNLGGNIYGVKIPTDATKIIFSNGGNDKTADLDLAGLNKLYDNGAWSDYSGGSSSGGGSSGGQDVNPSDYNIYYRNTKNWSEVYAYFWSDNNVNMTVWPGVKMTNLGGNIYGVKIPTAATKIIFSNGGNDKTADLDLAGLNKLYDNGAWSDYSGGGSSGEQKDITLTKDNVTLYAPAGTVDADAVLVVNTVSVGSINASGMDGYKSETALALDIHLERNGAVVRPNGEVRVSIKAPQGIDVGKCRTLFADGGNLVDMNAVYDNGYMVFTTNRLGYFVTAEPADPVPDITMGDVNGDGSVDTFDALLISRSDAGSTKLDSNQRLAADVNGDGSADTFDALLIARYDSGDRSVLAR